MKRAATITLLAMGVGGAFAASNLQKPCRAPDPNADSWDQAADATPQRSCHGGGYHSGYGGHASFFGGVSRGGFGGFGFGGE
jgi:hypothetical protein